METVYKKYFEYLDDARAAVAALNQEFKAKYNCYFCCSVWDAANDNYFENGRFFRWIVIADIWPDQN